MDPHSVIYKRKGFFVLLLEDVFDLSSPRRAASSDPHQLSLAIVTALTFEYFLLFESDDDSRVSKGTGTIVNFILLGCMLPFSYSKELWCLHADLLCYAPM